MNSVAQSLHKQLAHQKVLVLGLGRQGGVKVANRLVELGATVRVSDQQTAQELAATVAELKPEVEQHLGGHDVADVAWADLIVKNPAVPYSHPLILEAEKLGIPVTSETALALQFVRDRTIGVTGTRGKTTTSHLIWHILTQAGKTVELGGNIPQQPTLETVLNASDEAWFVLELSSFQLETLAKEQLAPHIAVLTSLSPDHLNRYGSMEEYVLTKAGIFHWQQPGDAAFWIEMPEWQNVLEVQTPNDVSKHVLTSQDVATRASNSTLAVAGEHNLTNAALAASVCEYLRIEPDVVKRALSTFAGVEYRQQVIPTEDGLTWINDTTATTPTALLTALNTFADRNFILITGGTTKNLPIPSELLNKFRNLEDRIIWLAGSGTNKVLEMLKITYHTPYEKMEDAVEVARRKASELSANTVILSPGFSSFENFKNEFDRGDQFNAAVKQNYKTT